MAEDPTYYALLNVSPNASPAEIRAAYLRFMRQHHPDLANVNGGAAATSDEVMLINRCYDTLKVPWKRAAYDASLATRSTSSAALAIERHAKRGGRGGIAPLLAVAAICGLVVLMATWDDSWLADAFSPQRLERSPTSASVAAQSLPLGDHQVREAARLGRAVSASEAVGISTDCFRVARSAPHVAAAELCVIFDQAFVYWHGGPNPATQLPTYFNLEFARARHVRALHPWGGRASLRLRKLQQIAFAALLQEIRGPQPDGPGAASNMAVVEAAHQRQ